jgi:hypothetical protein
MSGFLYCFTSTVNHNISYVGYKQNKLNIRLNAINKSTSPIIKLQLSIEVDNFREKGKKLHTFMKAFSKCFLPNNKYFNITSIRFEVILKYT